MKSLAKRFLEKYDDYTSKIRVKSMWDSNVIRPESLDSIEGGKLNPDDILGVIVTKGTPNARFLFKPLRDKEFRIFSDVTGSLATGEIDLDKMMIQFGDGQSDTVEKITIYSQKEKDFWKYFKHQDYLNFYQK